MVLAALSSFSIFLVCIFSSVRATDKGYSCTDMGQDIYQVLNNYFEILQDPTGEQAREMNAIVRQYSGLDIDNVEAIKTFSCKLMGMKSLDDLSTLINIPSQVLRQVYPMAVGQIRKSGGLEIFQTMWHIYRRFLIAAHDAGYPQWPLNITPQKTRAFISGMVDDFGITFPQLSTPGQENRDTVDIERFVEAVTEATTFDEFVEISGLSHSTVYTMKYSLIEGLKYPLPTVLDLCDAAVRVAQMVIDHHLLDLQ